MEEATHLPALTRSDTTVPMDSRPVSSTSAAPVIVTNFTKGRHALKCVKTGFSHRSRHLLDARAALTVRLMLQSPTVSPASLRGFCREWPEG